MSWALHVAKSAKKNLARFPRQDQERIVQTLRELSVTPYAGDIEKIRGEVNTWRRRIGNYRILYEIDNSQRVIAVRDIRRRTTHTY